MNQIIEELGTFVTEIIGSAVVLGVIAGAIRLIATHGQSLISWLF